MTGIIESPDRNVEATTITKLDRFKEIVKNDHDDKRCTTSRKDPKEPLEMKHVTKMKNQ